MQEWNGAGVGWRRPRVMVVVGLALGLCVAGCNARPGMLRADELPVPDRPPPAPSRHEAVPCAIPTAEPCRTVQVGRSVEGEPLTLHLFGTGSHPTLVIGGIHGDEPTSAEVAERLVALLKEHPEARGGATVAVLPRANPDGLARRTRKNANGVDLNRNLPAANWRKRLPNRWDYGGPTPSSEPETRALLRAIEMLRPARIISIHSIRRGRKCNNYDGPAEDLARLMERTNGYPVVASLGPCYGSLGNWAGVDRHIPILTLELPRELPGREAWEQNREGLIAVIRNGLASSDAPPVMGR